MVIDKYQDILAVAKSRTNLYGRQPISLEIQHVVDSLPNRYAVTDKADGDRYFLIVSDTRCYLISTNLIVKDTGINVNKKYDKTIIDGEYIFLSKFNRYIYMGFDCLVLGETNVREESKFTTRLIYLDEFIQEINKTKFQYKTIQNENIDFNNIDKVMKFHLDNIIGFYDDIDKELQKKDKNILFRRKYFIDSNGIQDNEIFKYTNLMWKNRCPSPQEFPAAPLVPHIFHFLRSPCWRCLFFF